MSRQEERTLLDTVRWISALMVGFGHAAGLLFSRDSSLASHFLWYIADMRGAWVMLFFVLSGYLVGGKFLIRLPKFNLRYYFIARFSRIYVVLVPALLLTVALDGIAYLWMPNNPVYSHSWPNGVLGMTSVFSRYNWEAAVASLLSVEPLLGGGMGSAGVLWSLGCEWVFYFAFPAIVLGGLFVSACFDLPRAVTLGALFLAAAGSLVAVRQGALALYWLVWISGALAHLLVETHRFPAWLRWCGAGLCAAGILVTPFVSAKVSIPMIGFGFSAFLSLFPQGERGIDAEADKQLAAFSYSFYLVHLPVLTLLTLGFVKAGLVTAGGVRVGPASLGCLLIMMVTAIVVAYAFGRLFEDRTDVLRRLLGGGGRPRLAGAVQKSAT